MNGSMCAVVGSGISSMSDAWMPFQPAIDEPSNAWPDSNLSSSNAFAGTETCCSLPRVSVKRRSTNLTSLSLIIFSTSAAVVLMRRSPGIGRRQAARCAAARATSVFSHFRAMRDAHASACLEHLQFWRQSLRVGARAVHHDWGDRLYRRAPHLVQRPRSRIEQIQPVPRLRGGARVDEQLAPALAVGRDARPGRRCRPRNRRARRRAARRRGRTRRSASARDTDTRSVGGAIADRRASAAAALVRGIGLQVRRIDRQRRGVAQRPDRAAERAHARCEQRSRRGHMRGQRVAEFEHDLQPRATSRSAIAATRSDLAPVGALARLPFEAAGARSSACDVDRLAEAAAVVSRRRRRRALAAVVRRRPPSVVASPVAPFGASSSTPRPAARRPVHRRRIASADRCIDAPRAHRSGASMAPRRRDACATLLGGEVAARRRCAA